MLLSTRAINAAWRMTAAAHAVGSIAVSANGCYQRILPIAASAAKVRLLSRQRGINLATDH